MIRLNTLFLCLGFVVLASIVNCESDLSKDEVFALTRDGFSRDNPDELLNGFFAAWPAILWFIAAFFVGLAIISFLGYVTGICRSPEPEFSAISA